MIKVARKAVISKLFKDALVEHAKQMLEIFEEEVRYDEKSREKIMAFVKPTLELASGIVKPNFGLDYEITRLRNGKILKADIGNSSKGSYFIFITEPVVLKGFDLGPYAIGVPVATRPGMSSIHMIRLANPLSPERHPHHSASIPYSSSFNGNPLDCSTNTCWNTFAGHVSSMLYFGRVIDLYFVLDRFLRIENSLSEFRSSEYLYYDKKNKEVNLSDIGL